MAWSLGYLAIKGVLFPWACIVMAIHIICAHALLTLNIRAPDPLEMRMTAVQRLVRRAFDTWAASTGEDVHTMTRECCLLPVMALTKAAKVATIAVVLAMSKHFGLTAVEPGSLVVLIAIMLCLILSVGLELLIVFRERQRINVARAVTVNAISVSLLLATIAFRGPKAFTFRDPSTEASLSLCLHISLLASGVSALAWAGSLFKRRKVSLNPSVRSNAARTIIGASLWILAIVFYSAVLHFLASTFNPAAAETESLDQPYQIKCFPPVVWTATAALFSFSLLWLGDWEKDGSYKEIKIGLGFALGLVAWVGLAATGYIVLGLKVMAII